MKKFPKAAKEPEQSLTSSTEEVEMLAALIGPIADLAGTWMSGKVAEKKAQSATKVAMAQAEAVVMQKKSYGEIDWDLEMAKGSQSSWKGRMAYHLI